MDELVDTFETILEKYWSEELFCIAELETWESIDLVALELFINAELQRRADVHDRERYPGIFDQTH